MNLEHEAVELGFRQRIGAFLLKGILCRKDKERKIEMKVIPGSRHHFLLHGLKKGSLRFGWSTIDLVGKDHVREYRAPVDDELAIGGTVDERADDVRRQQVGSELDALELGINPIGQRGNGKCLRQAGDAFNQEMLKSEVLHLPLLLFLLLPRFTLSSSSPMASSSSS